MALRGFLLIALCLAVNVQAKVRLGLSPDTSDDLFFEFKSRQVYIHDNKVSNLKDTYSNKKFFFASLKTGVFNVNSNSQNYVVDINAATSLFISPEGAKSVYDRCNNHGNNGYDCTGLSEKVQHDSKAMTAQYLKYYWYGPYQIDSTATGDKVCYIADSLTLLNKRERRVRHVGLFSTQDKDVTNCGAMNDQDKCDNKEKYSLENLKWQGVLALSPDAGIQAAKDIKLEQGTLKQSHSMIDQMLLDGLISKRIFALYFAKDQTTDIVEGAYVQHNFITFGHYEHYLCKDDLAANNWDLFNKKTTWIVDRELDERKRFDATTPTKKQLWKLELDYFKVHGDEKINDDTVKEVLFDTTTFDYLIPTAKMKDFVKSLGCTYKKDASPENRMTCETDTLPDIHFKFKDNSYKERYFEFTLTPEMYSHKGTKNDKTLFFLENKVKKPYTKEANEIVFGRAFLTRYYAIFDVDQQQITLTEMYLNAPDSWLMGSTVRWMIISFGIFTFILSCVALLAILSPIKTNKPEVVKQVRRVVVDPQPQPVLVQQPVYQQQVYPQQFGNMSQFAAPQSPTRQMSPTRFR